MLKTTTKRCALRPVCRVHSNSRLESGLGFHDVPEIDVLLHRHRRAREAHADGKRGSHGRRGRQLHVSVRLADAAGKDRRSFLEARVARVQLLQPGVGHTCPSPHPHGSGGVSQRCNGPVLWIPVALHFPSGRFDQSWLKLHRPTLRQQTSISGDRSENRPVLWTAVALHFPPGRFNQSWLKLRTFRQQASVVTDPRTVS